MIKRFLAVFVVFSVAVSCGGCLGAKVAQRECEGIPVSLMRAEDRTSQSLYCEPHSGELVCTDFERFLLWKLEQEARKNEGKNL